MLYETGHVYAFVVRATPSAAGAAIAKFEPDSLLSALDSVTRWTRQELGRLKVSDSRVAADPLRDGEPGLFVAFERIPGDTDEAEPVVGGPEPVRRALA